MKTPTLLRLSKETRAMLPIWVMTLLSIKASYSFPSNPPEQAVWSMVTYCLGSALLSATCFGHEFAHRTMGLLLSQPLPRTRIWLEKMFVLGVMLFGNMLLFLTLMRQHGLPGNSFLTICLLIVAPVAIGFCSGPTLTLLTRGVIVGTALTLICPIFLFIVGLVVFAVPGDDGGQASGPMMPAYVLISLSIYCACLLPLGLRLFRRLQDSNATAQELSLPAKLAAPFKSLPDKLTLGQRGPVASLIRKELRLQQPTFLVGLMIVVVWLGLVVAKIVHPRFETEALFLTPFMLGIIGIPGVAGILAVAEERNMGLHDWHLTLPISARRQWLVKTFMALLISMALGVVLPALLSQVSFWQFGREQASVTNDLKEFRVFPWLNLVLTSLALYASTFSANSLRALVSASILGIAIMALIDLLLTGVSIRLTEHSSLRIVLILLYLVFELGLLNFRRAAGSIWAPVRQIALFFAAMILLFCVSNI